MTWPQQPAASAVCQLFTAHQDLSSFKESQKNGPGDPWLQARDNLKMEPSLNLSWATHTCTLQPHQSSSSKRETMQDFPHPGHHFVTWWWCWWTLKQNSFCKSVHDTPWSFRLSEQLGTSNSGTLIASNGCVAGKPMSWHGTAYWMKMYMPFDW